MKKPTYYKEDVTKFGEGFVVVERTFKFEKDKTTPKGSYPKFNKGCPFPERADCNYGFFYERCPYMKCLGVGNWICDFKKPLKDKLIQDNSLNKKV